MKKRSFGILFAAVAGAAVLSFTFCGCSGKSPAQNFQEAVKHAGQGDWKKAEKAALRAAKQQPRSAALQLLLSVIAEKNGQPDAAIAYARRAVELGPEDFSAHYNLGRLYAAMPGQNGEAVKALSKAHRLNPAHPETLLLLSQLCEAKQPAKAIVYLQRLQTKPGYQKSAAINNNVGVLFARMGRPQPARKFLLKACKQGDLAAFCNLAVCFDRTGGANDRRMAVSFYQHYLARAGAAGEPAETIAQVRARAARLK